MPDGREPGRVHKHFQMETAREGRVVRAISLCKHKRERLVRSKGAKQHSQDAESMYYMPGTVCMLLDPMKRKRGS